MAFDLDLDLDLSSSIYICKYIFEKCDIHVFFKIHHQNFSSPVKYFSTNSLIRRFCFVISNHYFSISRCRNSLEEYAIFLKKACLQNNVELTVFTFFFLS